MQYEFLQKSMPFEGCSSNYEDANIVLIGAGYDGTSSYRPGSRFAPAAIRAEALYSQENYSPYFDIELEEKRIYDAGNLELPFGNKEAALKRIRGAAEILFKDGKQPLFLGGEHLITFPVIQAAIQKYPDLHILQIDAHLDLMNELFGEKLSHGTVMRRCAELLASPKRIYQIAIRSGSKEEFLFAKKNTRLYRFSTKDFLLDIENLYNKPIYLTLDLDAFDPSLIPGTGTPEAGGIFFQEYIDLLGSVKPLNIVGCDVVELAPKIDSAGTSTIVAAKIVRELMAVL